MPRKSLILRYFEDAELSNVTEKPRQLDLRHKIRFMKINVILSSGWVKTLLVGVGAA